MEKTNYCIYKITNKINNKVYIGQTKQYEKRMKQHKKAPFDENKSTYDYPLYRAIRKYGLENFDFEKIEENISSTDEMNRKEIEYIKKYNARNPKFGYNRAYGGNDQAGEHNNVYGFTGSKSWHAKKVIDITTGIIYNSMVDCAIEVFGDKKAMKQISKICNPDSNRQAHKGHIFRLVDENGNIIEKRRMPTCQDKIKVKETNYNITIKGISKTADFFNLSKSIITKRIYNINKFKSDIDSIFNFILADENDIETELTQELKEKMNKLSKDVNHRKRIYHGERNPNKTYKYEEIDC